MNSFHLKSDWLNSEIWSTVQIRGPYRASKGHDNGDDGHLREEIEDDEERVLKAEIKTQRYGMHL